jgi:hypothetical protein
MSIGKKRSPERRLEGSYDLQHLAGNKERLFKLA